MASQPQSRRNLPTAGTGILIGRPTISKASYEYVIIPRDRTDIDVLVTTLPTEIMGERYIINTRMIAEFLKGIYVVDYQWYRKPVSNTAGLGGFIDKGVITKVHGRFEIDIDNPLESMRKIDDTAGYSEIHDVVSFDMNFVRGVVMSASAVTTDVPKRSLSAQVATRVKEDNTPILLNIAEAYLYLRENPGMVRGVGVLRRYKLPILVIDEIPLESLREKIVYNMNASIIAFYNEYSSSQATATEEL